MIGKIERIALWKNSRGYFFTCLGRKWIGYGVPLFRIGQVVEFEEGERKQDGNTVAKNIRQPKEIAKEPIESEPIKPLGASKDFGKIDGNTISSMQERDATITRLACLKAAAILGKSAEETIEIAKKYERWARA